MARLRTFIAVAIDKTIRDRVVTLQETLARSGADVKWVEPENMHVTLLFLGEVEDKTLPAVCRVVADVAAGLAPFEMSVAGAGCFPNARRPKTLWVGIGDGLQELVALHDALEPPLLDLGCYRREDRQYTPHLTLGRVKGDAGAAELTTALARRTDWQGGQVRVREVLVMSSELRSEGPTYTVLGRGKLGG
jgi:RNA 2',3'-cyclic 3'-phosphodiesterase